MIPASHVPCDLACAQSWLHIPVPIGRLVWMAGRPCMVGGRWALGYVPGAASALCPPLSVVLLLLALMLLLLQAGVALACALAVFRPDAMATQAGGAGAHGVVGGLAGDSDMWGPSSDAEDAPPGLEPGIAAVLKPGGSAQMSSATSWGLLYLGSICVRWRDEGSPELLFVAAIVWSLLHVVSLQTLWNQSNYVAQALMHMQGGAGKGHDAELMLVASSPVGVGMEGAGGPLLMQRGSVELSTRD